MSPIRGSKRRGALAYFRCQHFKPEAGLQRERVKLHTAEVEWRIDSVCSVGCLVSACS